MRRIVCLCLLALGAANAQAEIFRYVDERGITVFTDRPPPSAKAELVYPPRPPAPAYPRYVALHREARRPSFSIDAGARFSFASAIQSAAAASNMDPALIHAVITAESNYNPYARSPSGALGLMQLMPETAKRYQVANRLDPVQNIHGGTRYLRDLMSLFNNDLRLALAAYNAGEQTVIRYGNRIPPNPETMNYVPRVLEFYRRYRAQL